MYIRMSITMLVQLYTSRIVLNALGVDDYGIYNIVGSIIVAFSFISGPLGTATQRFYNFELGKNNQEGVNNIFNHSALIYFILSILLFIIIEIAGIWFINNKMQLPESRLDAAMQAFHLSVLGFVFSLLKVPYESLIIAHERMSFYAYISIVDVILKLLNAFCLMLISIDKLKLYAVNQLIITLVILSCIIIYCKKQFTYIYIQKLWDKNTFKHLLSFSGWSLFGSVASMSANQGLNILLNVFYGVAVNAAMGIANQVSAAVNQFVTNFQVAFRPQIVKSYANNNLQELRNLISNTSKYSYLLLFTIVCPLCFNINFVLKIWLKNVPEYTSIFCIFILIYTLVETLSAPMWMTVQATGKIRTYQLVISCIIGLNILISYLFLKLGFSPSIVLQIKCCLDIVYLVVRLIFMRKMIKYSTSLFAMQVLIPICIISFISISFMAFFILAIENELHRLLLSSLGFILIYTPTCYYIALTVNERKKIIRIIKSKLHPINNIKTS